MRWSALAREIVRDIISGTSRTLLFALIATVVGGGLVVADTLATLRIIDEARDFRSSGASVITVTAMSSVNGEACEALSDTPGIEAAGALRRAERDLILSLLPAAPLPLYESTGGLGGVLGAEDMGHAGVTLPVAVLEALGSAPTQQIATHEGEMTVGGTYEYPNDGRRPGFGWAAFAPAPSAGVYDECWALVWPSSPDIRQLLLTTISANTTRGEETSLQLGQLNTRLGETFDGNSAFRSRSTNGTPLLALGLGAVLAIAAVWTRRLDYASRLHDGLRKSDLQAIQVAENASWSLPAAVLISAAGCVLAVQAGGADALAIGLTAMASASALIAGTVVGGVLTTLGIREASLFRYFKSR